MSEPQLLVHSAKALDLAQRLAQRERRSVADVVERALEAYAQDETDREPASVFYERISGYAKAAGDLADEDLETLLEASRHAHKGLDL